MIKDNQKRLNNLHVALDALVILFSYALAWYIQIGNAWTGVTPHNIEAMSAVYLIAGIFIVPFYLLLYAIFRLYTPKRVQGRRLELANILKANTIGLLVISLILYLGRKNDYFGNFSSPMLLWFFGINAIAEFLERNAIRWTLRSMRTKGYNQKHVLLVGYSRAAEGFIDRVLANPDWGYAVRGILDDHEEWGREYKGVRVIGKTVDLYTILDLNTLDEIAITLSIGDYSQE